MEIGSKTVRYENVWTENWEDFLQDAREHMQETWTLRADDFGPQATIDDFRIIRTIGVGQFGRILLAEKEREGFFAIKVLKKKSIVKAKMINTVLNEKRVMQSINFQFIVKMEYFFMNNTYLFFVMQYAPGGDLFLMLRRMEKMEESQVKFYAAQIVLALEYLHFLKIIYRDLKPENLLIGMDGYMVLADLGFCKVVETRTYTICGTPEYIAPEVMLSKGYGFAVDWWSLGILIYEMSAGHSPFKHVEAAVQGSFTMRHAFTAALRDILQGLLQINPSRRLGGGASGAGQVKKSTWFSGVDWMALAKKKVPAPFFPDISGPGDSSLFDTFPEKKLEQAQVDLYQKEFQDF